MTLYVCIPGPDTCVAVPDPSRTTRLWRQSAQSSPELWVVALLLLLLLLLVLLVLVVVPVLPVPTVLSTPRPGWHH
jgi:hypothetical protein